MQEINRLAADRHDAFLERSHEGAAAGPANAIYSLTRDLDQKFVERRGEQAGTLRIDDFHRGHPLNRDGV